MTEIDQPPGGATNSDPEDDAGRVDAALRAGLAERRTQREQIVFVCEQIGVSDNKTVGEVLERYGITTDRSNRLKVIKAWRAERGIPDTGQLPKLTDELLRELDALGGTTDTTPPDAEDTTDHEAPAMPTTADTTVDDSEADHTTPDTTSVVEVDHAVVDDTTAATADTTPVVTAPRTTHHAVVDAPHTTQADTTHHTTPVVGVVSPESEKSEKSRPWTKGLYASALLCLLMSLNTSWRFAGEHLHITSAWERAGLFLILETFLVSCAAAMVGAARKGADPGPVRLAVWAGAGVGVWMALGLDLGTVHPDWWSAGTRALVGPVGSVVALHLALGIEKRERRTRAGTLARVGRELRERMLSRLGLADDERDAAQRTRDRAATRAVELSLPGRWAWGRRLRDRQLQRALLAAGVADDPILRERLLARRQVAHSARHFAELEQESAWAD
ncbi:hypothetical protein [Nocardia vaccinii]|uniref:hypothetical protein n=1 Tax=Nocardia vaccinii TaxID=1822 RepID=UPI000AB4E3BF|nr:hypothetical protein [Nocardia vaccinii]